MASVAFEYQPLPVFRPFHASPALDRLIVGGYGSGKSIAGCAEIQAWGLEEPGAEFMVTRKTVPALRDTTEKIFLSLLPQEFVDRCKITRGGQHMDTLVYPNGTTYYFRGMDDWKKHRSHNLTAILWDEADEFTREDYDGMQSRIRQMHRTPCAKALGHTTSIVRNGNILACNPWGHNWIWEDFINLASRKPGTAYWTSTSFDNPYLTRDYLERLLAMPDPWVRRFVLCSFDEFAGAVYPEWSYDTHVIAPLKNSAGKYTYNSAGGFFRMGYDPGSGTVNAQTQVVTGSLNAGVWVYYCPTTHRLIAVAEYGEGNASVRKHTAAWRRIEATHGMRVQARIADPGSVNNRDRGSNMKLSDLYRREGFAFQLGPSKPTDRVWTLGELIASGRFVVTSECPRLYEQILSYRFEDLTPSQMEKGRELKPLKKDVDLVDAAQYAVSRYVPPPPVVPKDLDPEDAHSQEIHAKVRAQIARNRLKNARTGGSSGNVPV